MIQAGKLRHLVHVQAKRDRREAGGGVIEEWYTVEKRWAAIEPLRGRELLVAQEIDARLTHKVTLRYFAGLKATQRLLYGERVLHILTPPMHLDERAIVTQCLCMEDV